MFHFGSIGETGDTDASCELTFGDFSSRAVASSSADIDVTVPSPVSSSSPQQSISDVPVQQILGSEVVHAPPLGTEQHVQQNVPHAPRIAADESDERDQQPTSPGGVTGSEDASIDTGGPSAPESLATENELPSPKPNVSLKHTGSRARSSRVASRDDYDAAGLPAVPRQSKTRSPPPVAQPSPQDAASGVFLTDAEIMSSVQPSQTARQPTSDSEAFNPARAEAWLRARWDVIEAKMREENPQGARLKSRRVSACNRH